MIQHQQVRSICNPAAVVSTAACLLIAGCGGSGYDPPQASAPPPPPPDPHAVYPIVRVQDAAPTAADFIEDVELGTLLTATVNGQHLTLYTFKFDTAGTSNCPINADSTGCAKLWPP